MIVTISFLIVKVFCLINQLYFELQSIETCKIIRAMATYVHFFPSDYPLNYKILRLHGPFK